MTDANDEFDRKFHEARARAERKGQPRPASKSHPADSTARDNPAQVALTDFYGHMPSGQCIFIPGRDLWPTASVNARIPPVEIRSADGNLIRLKASLWIAKHRPVEQITWAPGKPMLIKDALITEGGFIDRHGCSVFNLYRPPTIKPGDAAHAGRWLDHVRRVYPEPTEHEHLIRWFAHRVQRPHEKINHGVVLGGAPGIGKDTIIYPVKYAVGPWNVSEVSPTVIVGRFNGFVKSVVMRISEARDLGDIDRYAFYEHMKVYLAAPPEVLRVDEKNLREYAVPNVTSVVFTTNHRSDSIYLPADDRRHFVLWSELTKDEVPADYWTDLYRWYDGEGNEHVAAYLKGLDLSTFDPKAPPPKTPAFWTIVDAGHSAEDAELSDLLDLLGNPAAVSIDRIAAHADGDFAQWMRDRKNRRTLAHRLERAGYVAIRNDYAKDGLWKFSGKRQAIYARQNLTMRDRLAAAQQLSDERLP